MDETNLHWNDLQLFLEVARAGGLAGATHSTGKSAPTLSRRMVALERVIGQELFHRQARGYELTDKGRDLLARLVSIESQIVPLCPPPGGNGQTLVRVSAGSWMTRYLCSHIGQLLEDCDNTRLCFLSSETLLDISRRETIIGIRNERPTQAGLAARTLGRVEFAGYATSPEVTSWIRVLADTPSARWVSDHHEQAIAVETSSPLNALDLAAAGSGIAVLPCFVGDAEPDLVRVTQTLPSLAHDQWLVTHQDERYRPAVRTVIDRLVVMITSLHGH